MNRAREHSSTCIARAQASTHAAENTDLYQRALIHLGAADTWLNLARRAYRIEQAEIHIVPAIT